MPATAESQRLERALRAGLVKIVDDRTRTMVDAWIDAWDEVSGDLQDALEALIRSTADGSVTRAQLLRNRRLQKALGVVADALDELLTDSTLTVVGDLRKIVNDAGKAQAAIIAAQLPTDQDLVDLEAWSKVDSRAIAAIVKRSTQQITARTQPLSDDAYRAVRRELIRGVAAGSNPRETARRMVKRAEHGFNGGLTRAINIARTEQLDAHRNGAGTGQKQHTDVLKGWVWLANLGPRTCRACLSMHGREFPLEVPGPLGHQQCRCSRSPVTKSWAELGFDDMDEPDDVRPSAEDHFRGLAKADQVKILGLRGYRAWRAGNYPISDWVQRRSSDGWRDSYVPSKPPVERASGVGSGGGRSPGGTGGSVAATPGPRARQVTGLGGTSDGGAQPPNVRATATDRNPARPSLAEFILPNGQPTAEHIDFVEQAWRDQIDRGFGSSLRAEAVTFDFYPGETLISGLVYDKDDRVAGRYSRGLYDDGTLWVDHHYLLIEKEHQGTGFAKAFNGHLIDWYRESGFERIEVDANIDVGGYTWAAQDFDFADTYGAVNTITRLATEEIRSDENAATVADVLDRASRYRFGEPGFPSAYEFSQAGRMAHHVGTAALWPGKRAMIGYSKTWRGVKWL